MIRSNIYKLLFNCKYNFILHRFQVHFIMKRTFVAIKISFSKQTVVLINNIKFSLKDEKIKWVENRNVHITLFFLGDVDEKVIDKIGNKLTTTLKEFKMFNLKCRSIGVFKNINNPKVLWFGINESDNLSQLKSEIDRVFRGYGFPIEDRDFKPHITIGRMKFVNTKSRLVRLIEKYKEIEIENIKISEIVLYESKITSKGSDYMILKSFYLN